MTYCKVPNSTSVPQHSSALSPQLGRRAFGHQRRMSRAAVARNITESILTHGQHGDDRPISFYTSDVDTQALVQAQLDTLAMTAGEVS